MDFEKPYKRVNPWRKPKETITVGSKRVIKSKEFLGDVRSGMSAADLMEKYGLSPQGFRKVLNALIEASRKSGIHRGSGAESRGEVRSFEEMRRVPRKAIDFPLWVYGDVDQIEDGLVLDASEKGIRVQGISASIGEERTFVVRFGPGDKRQPFVFDATCRWVNKGTESPHPPVAGFEITSISSLDAERLQNVLV